jgi:pimeloyl-ACP methyl ester carboxylesterase
MRERVPLLNRLREIQVPTLVIVGEDDEPLVEPSREIALNIPVAELEIIPGAAHSPTKEAPEIFNSILGSFLQRAGGNAV